MEHVEVVYLSSHIGFTFGIRLGEKVIQLQVP